jgi:hypothetical protein
MGVKERPFCRFWIGSTVIPTSSDSISFKILPLLLRYYPREGHLFSIRIASFFATTMPQQLWAQAPIKAGFSLLSHPQSGILSIRGTILLVTERIGIRIRDPVFHFSFAKSCCYASQAMRGKISSACE